MRYRSLSGQTRIGIVLIGFVLISTFFYYLAPRILILTVPGDDIESAAGSQERESEGFGLPVRLKISAINVDSAIESKGLTPDGAMDTPKGPDDVSWYNLGQRPGENGSAVIAGHFGTWKNGKGSVFDDLHKLRAGDKLSVEDDKGASIFFVVRKTRKFDPDEDASDVFESDDGQAHLNLITCEGVWDKASESYSQRLVVFTDKV